MITVFDKITQKPVRVYKITRNSSGYPDFLVRENGEWRFRSAKHYITYEETELYKMTFN